MLEQQLIEDGNYIHPRNPQEEFVTQATALPDEDAMALAARLFMKSEWRYIMDGCNYLSKAPNSQDDDRLGIPRAARKPDG